MTTPQFGSQRSDDDNWDIVSSVGYTALLVAGWRALHTVSPRPLVRDDYAKTFIAASGDPYLTGVLANPGTSEDELAFPRLYGVQTRFFDDFFDAAGAAGIRQAVIIAAGLDSRAYRLEWPPATTVFEVDLAKVLEFKARVLGEQGAVPKARRVEVAADLRADWSRPLEAAGFDVESPSAWSVEGLLPYLTDEAQHALFTRISGLSAPGSRIAIGALGSRLDHDQLHALEESHPGVDVSGNVDFSALTYEPQSDPAEWLAAHGWVVDPVRNTLDLQAGYGMTPPEVDVKIDGFMRSQYITAAR
ncbi:MULTISPECIES: class I SAM-dependent methyltransferase [Mycobacterium avium complex (MAC)]|uniref:S-adenosyl-L-methionine-dependent methyltransferase n=1 Tax=Mycobacterium avium subsp. hominissuis TaxID=439334 RepID=A0AAI8SN59_MYCAV|nr:MULTISPECIES: class I SAM-dependent methyltransferase [Mycobacterium avium complex (MAC)]ETB52946.1 S-adenosyl-L-methionine-dependent methyltransferase [Mycobacterium avium 10-5560]ETZ53849.1 methyltransferase, TIGR00027 family protein [Mycobacterium sp. MAC_011194_8550]ETZ72706.1 methyltransferase, TIGR00027 family protein [Mycobacterium sp. MAC_080597_8934]KDP09372.1 S-adenosyl-L-methionine-dependent methyltransferase [Mycobacterium avium subsp. hominissuis 100]MBZ4574143.1 class I SAM-de